MAIEEAAPKKMEFILLANDGETVKVSEDVALKSNLLRKMVADLGITTTNSTMLDDPLPVSNVNGTILKKIMEWCQANKGEYTPKESHENPRFTLTDEDKKFLDVTNSELRDMLQGANYLDIPDLIEIITQKIADFATGKTVEEIRAIYCLPDDFTPEEAAEHKKRFEWVEA